MADGGDPGINGGVEEGLDHRLGAHFLHREGHLRVVRLIDADKLREDVGGDAGPYGEPEHAADRPFCLADHFADAAGLHQHHAGLLRYFPPYGGGSHLAAGALEEFHVELLLKLPDHPAQGRLGHIKGFGGAGEAAVAVDGHHISELLQCHKCLK